MKADRWNAGIALMQPGSPDGWRGVAAAFGLVRINQGALAAYREAAEKAKKEQRCMITVLAQWSWRRPQSMFIISAMIARRLWQASRFEISMIA